MFTYFFGRHTGETYRRTCSLRNRKFFGGMWVSESCSNLCFEEFLRAKVSFWSFFFQKNTLRWAWWAGSSMWPCWSLHITGDVDIGALTRCTDKNVVSWFCPKSWCVTIVTFFFSCWKRTSPPYLCGSIDFIENSYLRRPREDGTAIDDSRRLLATRSKQSAPRLWWRDDSSAALEHILWDFNVPDSTILWQRIRGRSGAGDTQHYSPAHSARGAGRELRLKILMLPDTSCLKLTLTKALNLRLTWDDRILGVRHYLRRPPS